MLVIVTMRRLDRALQQLWKNVKDAILGVQEIVHPSEKEIVNAISIASIDDVEAPQEGAFYMIEPSSSKGVGILFLYQNGVFDEVTPEEGIIYIVNSSDKSHIYIYKYPLWEDVTGQPVDNTLYITNTTTALENYTDKGMYSVCLTKAFGVNSKWYTLTVAVTRGRFVLGKRTDTYIQTLINNDGWQRRTKVGDSSWSEWEVHSYEYAGHSHSVDDIASLQESLASKQPLGDYAQAQHTHVFADITDVSILPDNDAQIIIPIDDDILTSIVNQTYSPEDTAMFSGHSSYPPLSDEEVTRLVDLTVETYREVISLNQ